jgi:hypothetical protein
MRNMVDTTSSTSSSPGINSSGLFELLGEGLAFWLPPPPPTIGLEKFLGLGLAPPLELFKGDWFSLSSFANAAMMLTLGDSFLGGMLVGPRGLMLEILSGELEENFTGEE